MIFRLFPQDFEAVGSYRLIYPYGLIEQNTEHEVIVEVGNRKGKKIELYMPDPQRGAPEEDIFVFQNRLEEDAGRVVEWLVENGKTVVVELDDWWWDIPKGAPAHNALKVVEGISLAALKRQVRAATFVTVSTPKLAELVGEWNDNVHVIPNCVDAALLDFQRPRSDRVVIGWAGGASHANDFAFVRNELKGYLRRTPEVDVHIIGTDYRRELGRPDARLSGWSENLVEYLRKIDFSIGLAPSPTTPSTRPRAI